MDSLVVDAHTHIFPPAFRRRRQRLLEIDATFGELFSSPHAHMATAEELVEVMDADGVAVSVALGYGWCDQGVAQEANDYLLEAARQFPGRIVPFCGVNPAWGAAAVVEVERCAAAGARGIGELHPDSQGFDLSDRATMEPLMELARARGLVVTTHASEPVGHQYRGKGRTTPDVLLRFILSFPGALIVCAHWGGGLPFYALMPEVRAALDSVFFDTAASTYLYAPQVFRVVADLVGPEHVLLGSDYPLVRPGRVMEQASLQVTDARRRAALLGQSAARLLGIGGEE